MATTHIRLDVKLGGPVPILCPDETPDQTISFRHFRESIHPAGVAQRGQIERLHEPICQACVKTAWSFINGAATRI